MSLGRLRQNSGAAISLTGKVLAGIPLLRLAFSRHVDYFPDSLLLPSPPSRSILCRVRRFRMVPEQPA